MLKDIGNDQDWLYSVLGIRIIANNSLWLMNVKKNNYVIKEDIEDMKNMSIILLSFDTWIGLTHNEYTDILQKKLYINQRSKLIMDLTSDVLTTDYEYYVSCVNIFILEIYHIALKIKANEFSVEEIDCINMDILRTQHFFLKTMEDFTLIRYNDIIDDFSYYLELSNEIDNKFSKKRSDQFNHHNKIYNDYYYNSNSLINEVINTNDNYSYNNNYNNNSLINKSINNNYNNNYNNSYNNNSLINESINTIDNNNFNNSYNNYNNNYYYDNINYNNINNNSYNNNNNNYNNYNNYNNNNNENNETDSRYIYLKIINSISNDSNFFNVNHHFLGDKKTNNQKEDECSKTSLDIFKKIFLMQKDFIEQRKWDNFFLVTIAQRIYVNRMYIMNVINDPEKIKKYPIAKSIAIVCKSTDDCSICLKLLFESSEINNSLPLYFPFIKAWVFYQCAVIYSIRYIATYECKYNDNRQSLKYSTFSSFPQETLEPCYFYLNLLKDICKYFKTAKKYANSLKLLIYRTEKVVNERSFDVSFDDIII